MKKIFWVSFLFFLYGCVDTTVSIENDVNKEIYQGDFLIVGVVGSKKLPDVGNVEYEYIELSDVIGEKGEFDALIITSEAFSEADNNNYISFYDRVEFPVFFFGLDGVKMFAFTNENMNIENSKYDNAAYVEGFKNVNGKKERVAFYKSGQSDSDTDMLIRIFNSL